MAKIVSIEELSWNDKGGYPAYDGWAISTTDEIIKIGISSGASCCERFGTIVSEDNPKDYIGAEILKVVRVDTALKNYDVLEYPDEGGAMFVNIETDKGTLQFVAYNLHNGYYGHEAVLICKELNISERL